MNYHGKKFIAVTNTANGESSSSTVFHYQQDGYLLTAEYSGGEIEKGYILGKVDAKGHIDMVYQHVNTQGEIRTGKCHSVPYFTESGNLRLKESWQWTNGDLSHGSSEIEEI
ncbi:MAG: n-acetylglutamate synthase [Mongoliibacter sp.]|uniref:n-acetylglutamate synthase n=1 Tax=Mongoliibacter sp. TaxID=2022438 RepID=UPI0012F0AA11|nr:n-acetylglutamate synthase [Mongoliibacter sp.]TVP54190.1 MAG: n-acetylglutamate synthase [Mongoliibacter sp.]